MTKIEIETEKESGIVIPYTLIDSYVDLDKSLPTVDIRYLSRNKNPSKPNLKGGMTAWCLYAIVRNDDRKMLLDAANVFALNLEPTSWNVFQLKAVLKLLKTKNDTEMLTRKAELYEWWI